MKNPIRILLSGILPVLFLFSSVACSPSIAKKAGLVSYEAKLSAQTIAPFPDLFIAGNNQYGWTVASQLYDDGNLAISPASLELALLMTRSGAVGTTADEMKNALGMSGLSDDEILAACQQLMWRSNINGMEAANSIWMQKDYPFSQNFINICNETFMSDAYSVDFLQHAKDATDLINQWASDKTHGKIAKMNPIPLPTDTAMVLVNALYFLGDWETPFEAENTQTLTFHGAKSDSDVPFMQAARAILYSETADYQMVSLPFKGTDGNTGSPYSMAFILPAEGQDIKAVMTELADQGFSASCSALTDTQVNLTLPKFKFLYDTSMVETMKSLGMKEAFTGSAQFNGMTDSPNDLFISDILHKCYIRVDEKGAEAAAVTEVIMTKSAIYQDNPKIFNADRPFLFAIYDETDNTILFLGAVGQL